MSKSHLCAAAIASNVQHLLTDSQQSINQSINQSTMRNIPLAIALLALPAHAATVLEPNDVQIVAFASDAPDAMAFVTWVDLAPNTEIRFTDRGWACGAFQESGESELIFTVPSDTTITAGSVFAYEDDMDLTGTPWSLASGSFSLTSNPGDQLIVYQGTLDEPTPIFAFDSTGGWETDCSAVTDSYTSVVPDGLVDGVSAVSFDHSDSFWYRPWYAKSATLPTLKEWMANRSRFKTTSTSATRLADYQPPLEGFTILDGQRGANGYSEYIPGTAPCIILSGHDGDIYPVDIDDRTHGCWDAATSTCDWSKSCAPQDSTNCRAVTANDENTQDMARRASDEFRSATGEACHLIVNRLARIKLDPNREAKQAVQYDPIANNTYNEFHNFVEQARQDIENNHPCGAGLLIDFHGHTHPEARIEVGYKISKTQLQGSDANIDTLAYTSSVKVMPSHKGALFSEIIRGASSMGALFELPTALNSSGYLSVPSPQVNAPSGDEDYFQGGYNIEVHGSQDGGTIDAVQIEFPRYLRAEEFGQQADVLQAFGYVVLPQMIELHYPQACASWNPPTPTPPPTPECTTDLDCDQTQFCSPQICDLSLGCQPTSDPCQLGEFCLEASDSCVQCTESSQCEDNNECTVNRCLGDGTCDFTDSACMAGEVCNDTTKQCEAAPGWHSVFFSDFEAGWGDFNDGGSDAARRTGIAHSGSYSIRIRDNSDGASSMYTNDYDVSTYQSLRVEFWYHPIGMETGEDFLLEYSTDGGTSWTVARSWVRGTDFENGSWYESSHDIDASGVSSIRIRFRCDASVNNDQVFIDDVEFMGEIA